jgi:hypothetical protein
LPSYARQCSINHRSDRARTTSKTCAAPASSIGICAAKPGVIGTGG